MIQCTTCTRTTVLNVDDCSNDTRYTLLRCLYNKNKFSIIIKRMTSKSFFYYVHYCCSFYLQYVHRPFFHLLHYCCCCSVPVLIVDTFFHFFQRYFFFLIFTIFIPLCEHQTSPHGHSTKKHTHELPSLSRPLLCSFLRTAFSTLSILPRF